MAEFTITKFERLEAEADQTAFALGGMTIAGRKAGFAASIETTRDPWRRGQTRKRITMGLSRLDGEGEWIVDSLTIAGIPIYANGVGSRCTRLKALTDAEMVTALDAAAEGAMV